MPGRLLEQQGFGLALRIVEIDERLEAVSNIGLGAGEAALERRDRTREAQAIIADKVEVDEVLARSPGRDRFHLHRGDVLERCNRATRPELRRRDARIRER